MIPLNGTFYRVRNWADRYETHRSREIQQLNQWFPMPLAFEGLSFRWIGRCHSSEAVYGVQQLILQFAAKTKQPNRGMLVEDDRPLTAKHLATMTAWDVRLVEHAFIVLASEEVAFLEQVEVTDGYVQRTLEPHALPESAGRDTTETVGRDTAGQSREKKNATERDGSRRNASTRDDTRPAPPPDRTPPRREKKNEKDDPEKRGRKGKTTVGAARTHPNEKRNRGVELRLAEQNRDDHAEECGRAAELNQEDRDADRRDVAWLGTSTFKILHASGIAIAHYSAQVDSTQAVLRLVMDKRTRDADVAFMIEVATAMKKARRKHRMRDWQAEMNKKYGEPTNVGSAPTTKGLDVKSRPRNVAG